MVTKIIAATATATINGREVPVALVPDWDCWGWMELEGAGRYTGYRGRLLLEAREALEKALPVKDFKLTPIEWVVIERSVYNSMIAAGYRHEVVRLIHGSRRHYGKQADLIQAYAPALAEFMRVKRG